MTETKTTAQGRGWMVGAVVAVVVTVGVLVGIWRIGLGGLLRPPAAPNQALVFERVVLHPNSVTAYVRNAGRDPINVAQVLVDDAYWQFAVPKGRHLDGLATGEIHLDYPWVPGEPITITVLDSTGTTFSHEIPIATETPEVGRRTVLGYVLLGTYAGLIPVLLGLLFLPALQRIGDRGLNVLIGLTAGMLVFLAVDAVSEALEQSHDLAPAFQGVPMVFGTAALSLVALISIGQRMRARRGAGGYSRLAIAYLIALGIGLHNLGEGLAIGSAHAIGQIALSTFLVIGFALHNLTEGIGIVAPTVRTPPAIQHLLALGAIAGLPTIAGTLIGGFAFSPLVAVVFLSIGVGAILQVVWELANLVRRSAAVAQGSALFGAAAGFVLMYGTGVLVKA